MNASTKKIIDTFSMVFFDSKFDDLISQEMATLKDIMLDICDHNRNWVNEKKNQHWLHGFSQHIYGVPFRELDYRDKDKIINYIISGAESYVRIAVDAPTDILLDLFEITLPYYSNNPKDAFIFAILCATNKKASIDDITRIYQSHSDKINTIFDQLYTDIA